MAAGVHRFSWPTLSEHRPQAEPMLGAFTHNALEMQITGLMLQMGRQVQRNEVIQVAHG